MDSAKLYQIYVACRAQQVAATRMFAHESHLMHEAFIKELANSLQYLSHENTPIDVGLCAQKLLSV